jgi:preprotein translocase subunit YajC
VLISSAFAQASGSASGQSGFLGLLPIVLMFGLLYFLMIRPQMKLGEAYMTVEIAPDTEINVQKAAVQTLLPKGTIKSLQ